MNTTTTTSGTARVDYVDYVVTVDQEPEFPWHWPPDQRRMFVEIVEASERLAEKVSGVGPPSRA